MSEINEKTVLEQAENVENSKKTKEAKQDKPVKKKKEKKERKRPFREMISELKKVSWPTKADLRTYTLCVVVFVVVCSALLAVMDIGVTYLIKCISEPDMLPGVLNGWFNYGG